MKHVEYKCSEHGGCTALYHCMFCDGGLFLCTVCGQGEGELMPDCPGAPCKCAEGTCENTPGAWCRIAREIGTDAQ